MSVFTIVVNNSQSLVDITKDIPAQKITLLKYTVKVPNTYGGDILNIRIGNIIGSEHVIDTDAGFNYLKIDLSRANLVDGGTSYETVSYPQESFIMAGTLERNHAITVLDENHNILAPTDVEFLMLKFQLEY